MEEKLKKLLENSYSPIYNYFVSAIIECNDGKLFYGVNVETSSPSSGICAERNALYSAIAEGYKPGDFKHIYIMNKTDNYCFPCFVCRQALVDFCKNVKITTYNYNADKQVTVSAEELCPFPFESGDIK